MTKVWKNSLGKLPGFLGGCYKQKKEDWILPGKRDGRKLGRRITCKMADKCGETK